MKRVIIFRAVVYSLLSLILVVLLYSFSGHNKKLNQFDAESSPVLPAVDRVIKQEMAKQNIVGIVAGVVQNGIITHLQAYGHTDKERAQPMRLSNVFRWASVSKTVTAVAAWKAIEDNKMDLKDTVSDIVDYWPTSKRRGDITIEQLLSHRSGILHYGRDTSDKEICEYKKNAYSSHDNFNAKQAVDVFCDCNLAFIPGTYYEYSTFGFNLLGAAIEEATGKPYEQYVADKICNKANMQSMTAYSDDPGGYKKDCNGILERTTEGDVEWKLPGGGWASNINDMTDFLQGLINGTFLMNTSALWNTVPGNTSYCSGIFKETLGTKIHVYHGGDQDDVETYLGFFPADKTGVCFMINGGDYTNKNRLARKIENALGYTWPVSDDPIDYCDGDNDCGQTVAAIWRKTGKSDEIILRRGYNWDEFHEEWKMMSDAGYYADNIETWKAGSERNWDGIFKKATKASALYRGYSSSNWVEKWREMSGKGFRLIDLETYVDGSDRKWAGTFIEDDGSYAMYRNQSSDEFQEKYRELNNRNLKLIDVECYYDGYSQKWAGVWKGNGKVLVTRNKKKGEFQDLISARTRAGYKLIDIETYMDGFDRKWAGIWEKSNATLNITLDSKMCDVIKNHHNEFKKRGYELVDMEVY